MADIFQVELTIRQAQVAFTPFIVKQIKIEKRVINFNLKLRN